MVFEISDSHSSQTARPELCSMDFLTMPAKSESQGTRLASPKNMVKAGLDVPAVLEAAPSEKLLLARAETQVQNDSKFESLFNFSRPLNKSDAKPLIDFLKSIERSDPNLGGSWQHGARLRKLGLLEMDIGETTTGTEHLKQSVDILRKQLSDEKEDKLAGKHFTQALFDYGAALPEVGGIQNCRQADAVLEEAARLAREYNFSKYEQADILRVKGGNLAQGLAFESRKLAKTPEEADQSERSDLIKGIATLRQSLDLIGDGQSNEEIRVRAHCHSGLGRAQSLPAQNPIDNVEAEADCKKAIRLWQQYWPDANNGNQPADQAEINYRTFVRDDCLMRICSTYSNLLNDVNTKKEIESLGRAAHLRALRYFTNKEK